MGLAVLDRKADRRTDEEYSVEAEEIKQEESMKKKFTPEELQGRLADIAANSGLTEDEKKAVLQAQAFIRNKAEEKNALPEIVPVERLDAIMNGDLPVEPVFLEARIYPEHLGWAMVARRYPGKDSMVFSTADCGGWVSEYERAEYCYGWRCWNKQPTAEQMQATPWE